MSKRSSCRRRYTAQNYLRTGARPAPGVMLMHRAMRGHADVGTIAHVNFEPGDVVPSRGDVGRLIERLETQQLIVSVLHWILDNEEWLRHATLGLSFDAPGIEVDGYQLRWRGKIGRSRYQAARREIPRLCELLRSRPLANPRYVRVGVAEAMNDVDWCPDQVVQALGSFASPLAPDEGWAWIERHRQAHQLHLLQAHTTSVMTACAPRRL